MGHPLDVDTDAIRAMGTSLNGEADRVTGLDPCAALDAAVSAMQGPAIGAAASRAGTPLLGSYRAHAAVLREMAATAQTSAHEFDDTDHNFRRRLDIAAGGQ